MLDIFTVGSLFVALLGFALTRGSYVKGDVVAGRYVYWLGITVAAVLGAIGAETLSGGVARFFLGLAIYPLLFMLVDHWINKPPRS